MVVLSVVLTLLISGSPQDAAGRAPRALQQSVELTRLSPSFNRTLFGSHTPDLAPAASSPAKACHYNDPYKVACQADESNVTIAGAAGAVCAPGCSDARSCVTDFCPNHSDAPPVCALTDEEGRQFCALVCSSVLPIKNKAAADALCSTDGTMECQIIPLFGLGICTYLK